MPVFFINSQAIDHHSLTIDGPLHTHLTKSLRSRTGDFIWCVDEQRQRYHVRITTISKLSLEGTIVNRQTGPPASPVSLVLGLSILKGDHMTWAIQKATELGVHTIIPLIAHRCIIQPDEGRKLSYQERWQRIALDAAQQSERWDIPRVELPCPLSAFFESPEHDGKNEKRYILVERGTSNTTTAFSINGDLEGSLVIASGPEGGWTEEEKNQAKQCHFHAITLGTAILRAETAPLVALTLIQHQLGHFV